MQVEVKSAEQNKQHGVAQNMQNNCEILPCIALVQRATASPILVTVRSTAHRASTRTIEKFIAKGQRIVYLGIYCSEKLATSATRHIYRLNICS